MIHDAHQGVEAYPLYWPIGWPRTADARRHRAEYRVGFARARDDVLRSLRLLQTKGVLISTNVPLRLDGLPYANTREPQDPGVALYWTDRHQAPRSMACDRWDRVKDNLRAIGLTLEALRQIERSGASELLERAFAGFASLPADAGTASTPWRSVLGIHPEENLTGELIEDAYRREARGAHPDRGGSHEQMVAVNKSSGGRPHRVVSTWPRARLRMTATCHQCGQPVPFVTGGPIPVVLCQCGRCACRFCMRKRSLARQSVERACESGHCGYCLQCRQPGQRYGVVVVQPDPEPCSTCPDGRCVDFDLCIRKGIFA